MCVPISNHCIRPDQGELTALRKLAGSCICLSVSLVSILYFFSFLARRFCSDIGFRMASVHGEFVSKN